jgi:hypothetical protein
VLQLSGQFQGIDQRSAPRRHSPRIEPARQAGRDSALERAGGPALDQVALDEAEEHAGREHGERARGVTWPPVDRELGN